MFKIKNNSPRPAEANNPGGITVEIGGSGETLAPLELDALSVSELYS